MTICCGCACPAGVGVRACDMPALPATLQRLVLKPDDHVDVCLAIDLGHLTAVTELSLCYWQMGQEDLQDLRLPPNLVYLHGGVDASAVSLLTHLTALRRLGGQYHTDEVLAVMKVLPGLSHLGLSFHLEQVHTASEGSDSGQESSGFNEQALRDGGLGRAIERLKAADVEGVVRDVTVMIGTVSRTVAINISYKAELSCVLAQLQCLPNLSSLYMSGATIDSSSIMLLSGLTGLTRLDIASLLIMKAVVNKQLVGKELLQLPAALAPLSGLCELKLPQFGMRDFYMKPVITGRESMLSPVELCSILDGLAGLSQLTKLEVPWDYTKDEEPDVYSPGYRRVRTFVATSHAAVLARGAFNVANPQWN